MKEGDKTLGTPLTSIFLRTFSEEELKIVALKVLTELGRRTDKDRENFHKEAESTNK